mgnify:CR=1 FL=1
MSGLEGGLWQAVEVSVHTFSPHDKRMTPMLTRADFQGRERLKVVLLRVQ